MAVRMRAFVQNVACGASLAAGAAREAGARRPGAKPWPMARWFTSRMATPRQAAAARREADRVHRSIAADVRRLREDSGVTRAELARAAGIDDGFLARIEDSAVRPTIATLAKLAVALGADLTARLYPNTGPAIRDRHQSAIVESLLAILDRGWTAYPEVGVRKPARGWIDAVFHSERERCVVSVEIQSDLRRVEQQLRWFAAKAASLDSWEGWPTLGVIDTRSSLLVLRATRATRSIGSEYARQLEAAYPAHPADALRSLTSAHPWPGAALIWADVRPGRVRFLERR